jgi:hypothetical protein
MARQHRDGRNQHPWPGPTGEQSEARFGERGADRAAPSRGARLSAEPDGAHDRQPARHGQDRRGARGRDEVAGLRQGQGGLRDQERHADGDKDHLARDPFEDDRADAPPDVPGASPVPYRAVHVAEDTAGQRRVQEQSAVVVGDGPDQRNPDPQASGHQAPAPRAEHGGEQAEAESGQHGRAVDPAQTVEEGTALPTHHRHEDGRSGEHAQTRLDRPDHDAPPVGQGRASTSLWCTMTRNSPASHAARRRRRYAWARGASSGDCSTAASTQPRSH